MRPEQKPVVLLTGHPGVGKTTAVRTILDRLRAHAGGFYTREVLTAGARIGFELVTLDGATAWLATKDMRQSFPQEVIFGSYKVNVDAIDTVAVPSLQNAAQQGRLVVIDEIGPMELFSTTFCKTIQHILDDPGVLVFGTIVERPHPVADAVKAHPRVTVYQLTEANRDHLPAAIAAELMRLL